MTLSELLVLLRKHIVLVVLLTVVSGLGVFGASMLMRDEYTASTTMYVLSRNDSDGADTITQQDLSAGQMLTSDVATIMKSSRVEDDVAQLLGLKDLSKFKLNITSSTTTRVITLEVTGKNPQQVANVANAIVNEVSTVAQEVMQIQSINVIDAASAPTEPSGPRRLLYTAIGAMAGLFLATVIIVLRDMLDTRVRSGAEAEEIVGVPVVGHFSEIVR